MSKNSNRTTSKKERLFLLDGMALAYRAYFSFISRPLINSKGENTSAIFGFVNTLMKILNDEKPDHIAVVFDTKQPTFRHLMYQPYKATRQKMPEELSGQLEKLKEVVRAFNVPSVEVPGFEADDIMGTLARRAEKEGIETYLVTGDKDFMQLISPFIKMYRPGKRGDDWEILDETAVREKFGVPPEQVIDVLALIGDKSDNIPGVYGIGEKTAIPLVQEFGSVENILQNIHKVAQKSSAQKLEQYHDDALLSKKLVTIDTNVPVAIDFHRLSAKPCDDAKLLRLFTDLEFRSLIKKFTPTEAAAKESTEFDTAKLEYSDIATDKHTYHLVATEKQFNAFLKVLKKAGIFAFDTETSSVDPLRAELIGLSFAITSGEAWYISIVETSGQNTKRTVQKAALSQNSQGRKKQSADLFTDNLSSFDDTKNSIAEPIEQLHHIGLPIDDVLRELSPILTNPAIKKVGQNIKYDMLVLLAHGVRLQGAAFDTMVANYILRPDGQHNLDALAAEHLQYKMISYEDLVGKGKDQKALREIDVGKIADYSAEDADITWRLYTILKQKLTDLGQLELCETIEFPLISVLADVEYAGVSLVTRDIYQLCGEEFNINSTQQLSKILFEKLQLSATRKTKTGYSTDASVLEELRGKHAVIELLLEYRQLQKLKSTYIDAMPALINPQTGRIHTSFNQAIAATGRLSSSNPNLQNIPIRTEIGRGIRKAFIPGKPGHRILSADYSQIEMRIMAHISGDETLSQAFMDGEDIHTTTAARVYNVPVNDVSKEMRRNMKQVNYGIMYGIGPFGLSSRLSISQTEAKDLITRYFNRFPKVKQWIGDTLAKTRHDGYTATLLGRRRYFPDINSRNFNVRSNAERQAINMPIQGTAADMIKLAMINIYSRLRDEGIDAKMILQVHDELVFEIAKSMEHRAGKLVMEEMKNALPLSVPIEVEVGIGKNWLEAH
ncbi:MAG: DNA polymerase I [Ignavibacteriae bacterium]|nr:DNA polymerase I [Ignavibacteriota bacterium]